MSERSRLRDRALRLWRLRGKLGPGVSPGRAWRPTCAAPSRADIMGRHVASRRLRAMAWVTVLIMGTAVVVMFVDLLRWG